MSGIRGSCERDVGLGDAADGVSARDIDTHLDLALHLLEGVAQSLNRALDVGLHDEVQVGLLALFDAAEQVVEAHVGLRLLLGEACTQRALLGKLAGIALVFEYAELVACGGNAAQAEDLNRIGRACGINMFAARVDERTDAAVGRARHGNCRRVQRTAVDEHRRTEVRRLSRFASMT